MTIEISFPRGGRKPPTHKTAKVHRVKYDLFGKKKIKQKNRDIRNEMGIQPVIEKNVCPTEIVKTSVDLPTYRAIQEGMVLMGAVREIQKMTITVSLPGRISGRVMITQVSAPYTKLLHEIAENKTPDGYRSLKELFQVGQFVAVKVVKINNEEEKFQVNLSMAPYDVNSDLLFSAVTAGMLLWGAVSGCEEHGYVIDLGIKNCRAFLPNSNVDDDKKYSVGELLWCIVQKSEVAGVASIVTVNSTRKKIESTSIIKDVSLDCLLPGMQVDLTVNKILSNGLEGKFLNDYTGYVHEGYLQHGMDKLSSYKVGQVLTARILYIAPITKFSFLTLRNVLDIEKPDFETGTVSPCNILNVTRGGLYVKINKKLKGFVSFKRLKTPLSLKSDLDYTELVKRNYKIGSQHTCRLLDYDYMEQIYICTMEKELLKEQVFSHKDLSPGQNVMAEIKEIQKNGLLVQVGRITGFILNEHLTDAVLLSYSNIKSKYSCGQKLKAKVWTVSPENSSLLLTVKPSLLATENCLTSYETAEYNKQFLGIIVQITKNGVLVRFFGNVKGWIPKNQLSFEKVTNPDQMFTIGQIVNCTVIKCEVKSQKLTLSLQPPKTKSERKKLRLGQHVDVTITSILTTGLEVQVKDTKAHAVVPSQHLTHCPSLSQLILETYTQGEELKNLVCVNTGHGVPILSLRDNDLNEENVFTFDKVKPQMLLRCSVNCVREKHMLLQCPINDFDKLVVVPSAKVCDINKKTSNIDIKKNQLIFAKVTNINRKNKNIYASTQLSESWDGDLSITQKLLSRYLIDLKKINENWVASKKPLTNYKLGELVTGTVAHVSKSGSVMLNLPFEVVGKIDRTHSTGSVSEGDEVQAVVIWLNYNQNCVELTLKPEFISRINRKQNGRININLGKNAISDVILVKKECILVALRGNGNRQLAYMPSRLHPNDLLPNTQCYNVGDEIKIKILEADNGYVIGMPTELLKNFEKAKKAMKRTRTSSESSNEESKKKKRKTDKVKHLETTNKEIDQSSDNEMDVDEDIKMEFKSEDSESEEMSEFKEKINTSKSTKQKKINKALAEVGFPSEADVENDVSEIGKKQKKKNKKRESLTVTNSDDEMQNQVKTKTITNETPQEKHKKKKQKTKKLEPQSIDNSDSEVENDIATSKEVTKHKKKNKKKQIQKSADDSDDEAESEVPSNISGVNFMTSKEITKEDEKKQKKKQELQSTLDSDDEVETQIEDNISKSTEPVLSGVNNFWISTEPDRHIEESSEDEKQEEEDVTKKQKKKKLTPAERAELAREEEERLRKIETELADADSVPKTADQFDRLVMANPNSSMLWINYIAFHLEATEIEKARAVARKALNTIEFREEQEKMNVWIAFLNLENRYGTKESFLNILEEAIKMNEALNIHLQALHILAESNKTAEFLELLNVVTRRYKQEPKMWTSAAEACYKCDQKEQARNLMQKAIKSLEEKKHINLIVQFAFLESKWGEPERAEAILEKILASYPRRVDVWSSYVDMLVKANRIHIARNVLERAVSQKLPPKKMKTLFKKFIQFESRFGDDNSLRNVRQLASDYVNNVLK